MKTPKLAGIRGNKSKIDLPDQRRPLCLVCSAFEANSVSRKHSKGAGVWEPTASPCHPQNGAVVATASVGSFQVRTNARPDQKCSISGVICASVMIKLPWGGGGRGRNLDGVLSPDE